MIFVCNLFVKALAIGVNHYHHYHIRAKYVLVCDVVEHVNHFHVCVSPNSGPKNKRRNKKNERRRSSRDRRGDYYEDSSSPHGPPSGGSRDNRYNDMAPK